MKPVLAHEPYKDRWQIGFGPQYAHLCFEIDGIESSLVAQQVKDPGLLQLWHRPQLSLGSIPSPGTSTRHRWSGEKKKKRKKMDHRVWTLGSVFSLWTGFLASKRLSFPMYKIEVNNSTCPMGILWKGNDLKYSRGLGQGSINVSWLFLHCWEHTVAAGSLPGHRATSKQEVFQLASVSRRNLMGSSRIMRPPLSQLAWLREWDHPIGQAHLYG